jgi:hypothetical protein
LQACNTHVSPRAWCHKTKPWCTTETQRKISLTRRRFWTLLFSFRAAAIAVAPSSPTLLMHWNDLVSRCAWRWKWNLNS